MTQLHLQTLRLLLRAAARGRAVSPAGLARALQVPLPGGVAALRDLERAGLANGTRLTLSGLALAVATRRGRRARTRVEALAA